MVKSSFGIPPCAISMFKCVNRMINIGRLVFSNENMGKMPDITLINHTEGNHLAHSTLAYTARSFAEILILCGEVLKLLKD